MANEIVFPHDTGRTVYMMVFSATGTIWNTAGAALETYAGGSITDYDIALSELGTASGLYQGSMPAATAGFYTLVICERTGGSPAQTDAKIGIAQVYWTGTAMIYFPNSPAIDSSGNVAADVVEWKGTTAATVDTAGYPVVTIKDGTGAGELNLASGVVDANVVQVSGDATAGDRLEAFLDGVLTGTVTDASASTTDFDGDAGLSATDDFYIGSVIQITSGTLAGLCRRVSDYTGSTKNFTFVSAWPSAPANGVTFNILGRIDA
jgi:hypothetical protein